MNPNFKKKKPLPYKNLGELYIETAYYEPSISRLVSVLLEDETVEAPPRRKTVKVISQDTSSPEASAGEYTVDKVYFSNEIIPRLELGRPDKIEIRNIIKERLAGLKALNFEKTTDIYQEFVERLGIVLDDDNANKFSGELTSNMEDTFSNLLKRTYNLTVDPSSMGALWFDVINAIPKTAIQARAGEGELFISFFSHTGRPSAGDVKINNQLIEIKGNTGRLFTGGVRRNKLPTKAEFAGYNDEQKINFITNFIINLAGGGKVPVIEGLVKDNLLALSDQLYKKIQHLNASDLTRIIGAQHLLLYKNVQGFNNFLIFNKNVRSPNISFISFAVPDTLPDMIQVFKDKKITVKIYAPHTGGTNRIGHQIVWPASKNA